MEQAQFEKMVARLEEESRRSPTAYQFKVGLLALLGFGLILLIMSFAGAALLLLAGFAVLVAMTGGKALLLLVKLGKLLVLLAIPCWMLIRSSLSAMFVRLPKPQGIELQYKDAPALFDEMKRMRQRMKGPRFHHVLITDEVNAAVVQRPLLGLFGFQRNYLILGLPLMESMSPEEMLAVVAHEYGHLAGSHSRFGAYIYRLRNTWGTINNISAQWSGWIGRKLHGVVSWYAPYFNAYTFVLARADEYQADAASAELAGAHAAQSALKRVNIAAAHHDVFMGKMFDAVSQQASPPSDLAVRWASVAPQASNEDKAQEWLANALKRAPHYADTHPALAQRLQALSPDGGGSDILPPALEGETAARRWLGARAEGLRQQLQQQWHARIAGNWQVRHAELREQIERLQTLRALPTPTDDEQVETLRLQTDLEPEADNIGPLAAFNAAHPERLETLFLEACLRLNKDDEAGMDLLDRVMAQDANATKPVCEKAYAWLQERDAARAETYAKKWRERDEWEYQRHSQLDNLDLTHELVVPELDAQTLDAVHALLRPHKGIAKAWLVRRLIPADSQAHSYVLGVQLTLMAKLLRRESKIVAALSKDEWPMHLFICSLASNKPLRKKLKTLSSTEIRFHELEGLEQR